jgi:anti-sigma B factor antagonist
MSDMGAITARVRLLDKIAIIDLRGEIDGTGDKVLARAYAEATASHPARLLLNFAGVDYINSTGIAVIVAVLARARKDMIPITSYGLTDHYQEVFRITRLADFMQVFKDEDTAVRGAR